MTKHFRAGRPRDAEYGNALLRVRDVHVRFGGINALDGLTFDVEQGSIVGLIGPNGAGKTTIFNVISRVYDASSGRVHFDDTDLLTVPAHKIAALGIARTFQNLALFPTMSLIENVMIGAHCTERVGFTRAITRIGVTRENRRTRDRSRQLLDFLGLGKLESCTARNLPFGTLKRLEIARALASRPRFLLLDEPASGLTHGEVDELTDTIRRIRDEFVLTILLVEHHMAMVMGISDQVVAMDHGRKIADGAPGTVREHPAVVHAYLGASS